MAGLDHIPDDSSPSIGEPVTLAQAKKFMRVDFDDDDDDIGDAIRGARSAVEAYLKQTLLYTAWRLRLDGGFPWEIRLPVGPVRTTEDLVIQYVDDAGATQTLASSEYQVSLGMTCVIRPAYGKTWPSVRAQMDAVTVSFKSGEESVDRVKPAIMSALRLEIGNRYANRESIVVGTNATDISSLSARNLLTPFVRHD